MKFLKGSASESFTNHLSQLGHDLAGEALDLRLALGPMGHHKLQGDMFHADLSKSSQRFSKLLGIAPQPVLFLGDGLRADFDGKTTV